MTDADSRVANAIQLSSENTYYLARDTIQNSQGRVYAVVVIPITTQNLAMLRKTLLYTGISRDGKLVILLGQRKAVAIAVKGTIERRRWSKIREWPEA